MQWQTPLCTEPSKTIEDPRNKPVGIPASNIIRSTRVMDVDHNTMQPTGEAQGNLCCTHQEVPAKRPHWIRCANQFSLQWSPAHSNVSSTQLRSPCTIFSVPKEQANTKYQKRSNLMSSPLWFVTDTCLPGLHQQQWVKCQVENQVCFCSRLLSYHQQRTWRPHYKCFLLPRGSIHV